MDLVELIMRRCAWSPNTDLTAGPSTESPAGGEGASAPASGPGPGADRGFAAAPDADGAVAGAQQAERFVDRVRARSARQDRAEGAPPAPGLNGNLPGRHVGDHQRDEEPAA